MNKKLLLSLIILLVVFASGCTPKTAEQNIAEKWIEIAPTYSFDGYALTFLSQEINESTSEQQILKYKFTSTYEGYGDRTGLIQIQKPTEHTVTLHISGEDVIFAELDTYWDEINQKKLYPDKIKLKGQPAQCVDTPWEAWFREGNIEYPSTPTHDQLITDYYAEQNIEIIKTWNIPIPVKVCTGCGFCPRGYTLIIKVYEYDVQKLLDDSWVLNNNTETGNILFSDKEISLPVNQ